MKKKKVLLKDLGIAHIKKHLIHFFPFLKKEYRKINSKELNSMEVLKELFGDKETDISKLKTLYKFQSYEV